MDMNGSAALREFLTSSRERVDAALDAALPAETEAPPELHRAMRYAVFSGGKRLRPALVFGAAVAAGVDPRLATPVACAVELVHACSLVLDDLPALDDNAQRRGHPSVHVAFGHATAILAANGLLVEAFAQCTRLSDPAAAVAVGAGLARAIGSQSLIGGEADDLAFAPSGTSLDDIASIHLRKTATLFSFAAWSSGVVAGLDAERLDRLGAFGRAYGLTFQFIDDLLDADLDECSILHVLSPEQAGRRAREQCAEAARTIKPFGASGWVLASLIGYLEELCPDTAFSAIE